MKPLSSLILILLFTCLVVLGYSAISTIPLLAEEPKPTIRQEVEQLKREVQILKDKISLGEYTAKRFLERMEQIEKQLKEQKEKEAK